MSFPVNLADIPNWTPAWAGVKELNISDAWRAMWVDAETLPENAPIIHGYVVVMSEGKGYATRRSGATAWGVAEGVRTAEESPEQFAKRISLEQTGASSGRLELMGYFECKASSHNPDFPVGTATVRPIYAFIAKKMKELGKESGFERRRLPLNEFARTLRASYPELNQSITKAVDRYMVLQAKGEA
jgi:hypothetical protein